VRKELIKKRYLKKVCKLGQGEVACKYLSLNHRGWTCLKIESRGFDWFVRYLQTNGRAQGNGDNCDGWEVINASINNKD
jgi:hypothetical protein